MPTISSVKQCHRIIWGNIESLFIKSSFTETKIVEDAVHQLSKKIISGQYDQHPYRYNDKENIISIALTLALTISKLKDDEKKQWLCSKDHFFNYLETAVKEIPLSQKKIKSDTKLQRRMDSLSRLLSLHSRITPCIAVAFIEDKFYITANTPADLEQFKQMITSKLNELSTFIESFIPHPNNDQRLINRQNALHTAQKLAYDFKTHTEITGTFLRGKYSPIERLQIDLLKVAAFFYENGFSQTQRNALIQQGFRILETPDREEEEKTGLKFHAEQLMLMHVIRAYHNQSASTKSTWKPIPIGINKLVCNHCERVLDQHSNPTMVQYRGSSDITFGQVATASQEPTDNPPRKITHGSTLHPEDSDSCEEYKNERREAHQQPVHRSSSFASCRSFSRSGATTDQQSRYGSGRVNFDNRAPHSSYRSFSRSNATGRQSRHDDADAGREVKFNRAHHSRKST